MCTKNIALYREFADQNLRKKNEGTEKTYHATARLKGPKHDQIECGFFT
jgi:hypothetical protein